MLRRRSGTKDLPKRPVWPSLTITWHVICGIASLSSDQTAAEGVNFHPPNPAGMAATNEGPGQADDRLIELRSPRRVSGLISHAVERAVPDSGGMFVADELLGMRLDSLVTSLAAVRVPVALSGRSVEVLVAGK